MVNSIRTKNEELQHKAKPKREMSIIQLAKAVGNQAIIQRVDPPGMIYGDEYERLLTEATGTRPQSEIKRPGFSQKLIREVWNRADKDKDGYPICEVCDASIEWTPGMPRYQKWHVGHRPGFEFWRLRNQVEEGSLTYERFLEIHRDPSYFRPEHPHCNQGHSGEMPK